MPKPITDGPLKALPADDDESAAALRFEQRWRERFVEFATSREDDAGIAGWSPSGLESRFRFFRKVWRDAAPGSLYLDVGCGAGTYSRWLAAQRVRVVGIDYSQPTLIKARDRTNSEVMYCAADATRLPFADASVDGVVCLGVVQALRESGPLVLELARVLRNGGMIFIDALNYHGLAAIWDRRYREWKRKPMHLRYETRCTIEGLLRHAGFDSMQAHWLPLMPGRLHRLQPAFESRVAAQLLVRAPWVASAASHAFLYVARRRGRIANLTV